MLLLCSLKKNCIKELIAEYNKTKNKRFLFKDNGKQLLFFSI